MATYSPFRFPGSLWWHIKLDGVGTAENPVLVAAWDGSAAPWATEEEAAADAKALKEGRLPEHARRALKHRYYPKGSA